LDETGQVSRNLLCGNWRRVSVVVGDDDFEGATGTFVFVTDTLLIAFFGAQMLVLGNCRAKLPPLKAWLPASLLLSAAGEAAILRLEGWLLVAYGLIVVATAFLIPMSLIAPLFASMSLALLIVILIGRRQLKTLTH
jgi:hypothetical protein